MNDASLTESPVMARLVQVLRQVFGDPTLVVRRDSWAHNIDGWDSFKLIEIILECRLAFGLTLDVEEMDEVASVGDFVDRLTTHLEMACIVVSSRT